MTTRKSKNKNTTKTFKTKRLFLRPYRMSDAETATKNLRNQKISRWLSSLPKPYQLKDAKDWIRKTLLEQRKKNPSGIVWVIEKDGLMVGAVGLHNIQAGHQAEIGYWLAESVWGQGVMTEAAGKILAFAFREFKLVRISGKVFEGNVGSNKVLEKCGFEYEGLIRKGEKIRGRFISYNLYAKLK